jgi:hypothetical protein
MIGAKKNPAVMPFWQSLVTVRATATEKALPRYNLFQVFHIKTQPK